MSTMPTLLDQRTTISLRPGFEAFAKLTVVDMIKKILKRSVTDKERKLIEDIHKEGKTLTEILENSKRK